MINREIQKRNLDALVRNKWFQFTDTFFPYTSGKIGPYYVQSIAIENSGEDYKTACDDLAHLVNFNLRLDDFDIISGGESRDWDFSNVLSYIFVKPHSKIYKDGRIIGATDLKGNKVIHVADLNNEGSSPRDLWVPAIKKAGGNIEHIFFYVDRMEDGVKVMKELGLQSHSVVPLNSHAWQHLQDNGTVSKEIYDSLMARMENKDEWARNMLRSEKGLETLANLFRNPETVEEGRKIINKGYLDLRSELIERLRVKDVKNVLDVEV